MMIFSMNTFIFISLVSMLTFANNQNQVTTEDQIPTFEEASMAVVDASVAEKTAQKTAQPVVKVEKSESEIPLQLEQNKKDQQGEGSWFRILFSFSILGLLFTGAYYYFKNRVKTGQDLKKTQIRMLTQHYLGPKKSLAIIRVAGESILIGITENNINLIKSLSLLDEELPEETPQNFAKVMGKLNQQDFAEDVVNAADEVDDFSIKGVKDVVTKKLRNMRNLE